MRVLTENETENVGGGIAFLAPVAWVMLADTGFWGAMGMSFWGGYKVGTWLTHELL